MTTTFKSKLLISPDCVVWRESKYAKGLLYSVLIFPENAGSSRTDSFNP